MREIWQSGCCASTRRCHAVTTTGCGIGVILRQRGLISPEPCRSSEPTIERTLSFGAPTRRRILVDERRLKFAPRSRQVRPPRLAHLEDGDLPGIDRFVMQGRPTLRRE